MLLDLIESLSRGLKMVTKELLEIVLTTDETALLRAYKDCVYPNVRRNIASNPNAPTDVINYLTYDCVANVSYMASIHKNCTKKRSFNKNDLRPCVICDDYTYKNCKFCNKK